MGPGEPFPPAFSPTPIHAQPGVRVYLRVNTDNLLPRPVSLVRVEEADITALSGDGGTVLKVGRFPRTNEVGSSV